MSVRKREEIQEVSRGMIDVNDPLSNSLATGALFGALLTYLGGMLKDFTAYEFKKGEMIHEARRNSYAELLGSLRLYSVNPSRENLDKLDRLLSASLLYAAPKLRELMIVCAYDVHEVKAGSVPISLAGKGLAKLESLMKDELGIDRTNIFHRAHRQWKKCPCGGGKRFKECHGRP